jgi:hypothetical protein
MMRYLSKVTAYGGISHTYIRWVNSGSSFVHCAEVKIGDKAHLQPQLYLDILSNMCTY